jgi:hypothetical protein
MAFVILTNALQGNGVLNVERLMNVDINGFSGIGTGWTRSTEVKRQRLAAAGASGGLEYGFHGQFARSFS